MVSVVAVDETFKQQMNVRGGRNAECTAGKKRNGRGNGEMRRKERRKEWKDMKEQQRLDDLCKEAQNK